MKYTLASTHAWKQHAWLGGFGHSIPKPTYFYGTLPKKAIRFLIEAKPSKAKQHQKRAYKREGGCLLYTSPSPRD
eukprot:1150773-Alexandrium_andersonii.AAC.1